MTCQLCNGEGQVDRELYPSGGQHIASDTCPACQGESLAPTKLELLKPTHSNLYNTTSTYQQSKAKQLEFRSKQNQAIANILGISVSELQNESLKPAA